MPRNLQPVSKQHMSSFSLKERFAFIEHMVRWYGGVTASQMSEVFGITRTNAQIVMNKYSTEHPDNLNYSANRKRKEESPSFTANYLRNDPSLFLGHLKAGWHISQYREYSDWEELRIEDTDSLTKINIDSEAVKNVVSAIIERSVLLIKYQSSSSVSDRVISPNQLVHADFRYHLRAFCHKDHLYKDFVLGRIIETKLITHHPENGNWIEWRSNKDDKDWNEYTELKYKINPDLENEIQNALKMDYFLDADGILKLKCRKALVQYLDYRYSMIDTRLGLKRWVRV